MGKIYKQVSTTQPIIQKNIPTSTHKIKEIIPQVIPLEQFDKVLNDAKTLIGAQQYTVALPLLLNLEVTNFSHIEVHELLAEVFLQLNQIDLAKEQCQIYARLLKEQNQESYQISLKSFEELYQEAGNFEELQKEFTEFQSKEIDLENFYQGTNIALKMATHYMANNRFQDAEKLLIDHRDRYMIFLEDTKESLI